MASASLKITEAHICVTHITGVSFWAEELNVVQNVEVLLGECWVWQVRLLFHLAMTLIFTRGALQSLHLPCTTWMLFAFGLNDFWMGTKSAVSKLQTTTSFWRLNNVNVFLLYVFPMWFIPGWDPYKFENCYWDEGFVVVGHVLNVQSFRKLAIIFATSSLLCNNDEAGDSVGWIEGLQYFSLFTAVLSPFCSRLTRTCMQVVTWFLLIVSWMFNIKSSLAAFQFVYKNWSYVEIYFPPLVSISRHSCRYKARYHTNLLLHKCP